MAQIHVTIRPTGVDLFSQDNHDHLTGVLSDEHPASSYGIPVLIVNGQPMGRGDIPVDHEIVGHYSYSPSSTDIYETDEQIRARRSPAQVALAQAAQQAGYPIANS